MISLTFVQEYFTSVYRLITRGGSMFEEIWRLFARPSLRKILKNYKNKILYIEGDLARKKVGLSFTVKLLLGSLIVNFRVAWSQD